MALRNAMMGDAEESRRNTPPLTVEAIRLEKMYRFASGREPATLQAMLFHKLTNLPSVRLRYVR
jgi:hypothetical protein